MGVLPRGRRSTRFETKTWHLSESRPCRPRPGRSLASCGPIATCRRLSLAEVLFVLARLGDHPGREQMEDVEYGLDGRDRYQLSVPRDIRDAVGPQGMGCALRPKAGLLSWAEKTRRASCSNPEARSAAARQQITCGRHGWRRRRAPCRSGAHAPVGAPRTARRCHQVVH